MDASPFCVSLMKILIVDDQKIVLDSCKRILEEDGFAVTLATSADEAVERIRTETFSLILLDIKMPGRDGMSLMRQVKETWPQIPIIVMSGYTTPETIAEVSETDAATFIAKPFTPDELLDAVGQVIQREGCDDREKSSGNRR
jgi:DNA-binding NtrC family response regulator